VAIKRAGKSERKLTFAILRNLSSLLSLADASAGDVCFDLTALTSFAISMDSWL